jgi:hypothetical protein
MTKARITLKQSLLSFDKIVNSPIFPNIREYYMRINAKYEQSGNIYRYCYRCVRLTKYYGKCYDCKVDCCDQCGDKNEQFQFQICNYCLTQCPVCNRIIRSVDTQLLTLDNEDYNICIECFPTCKEVINSKKFQESALQLYKSKI